MTSSATEELDTAQTDPGGAGRILALDGIRGIAVLAVLLFHTADAPFAGGYLGVDIFFVLSGFLIAGILFDEWNRHERLRLGNFWLRRARRLAPALLVLLLALAVARLAVPQTAVEVWRADILAALTYTTNWFLILTGAAYFESFGVASPLLHTWSLAIEEQFYLGFAVLLLILLPRVRSKGLVICLVGLTAMSAAWMAWTASDDEGWAYFSTGTRIQALLVGALLALAVRRASKAWWRPQPSARRSAMGWFAAAGLLLVLVAPPGQLVMFRGGFLVVALLVAVLIWSVLASGRLADLLTWRPLVALGVISYGVYLWHWPLFLMLRTNDPGSSVGLQVWAFLLTIVVATGSYLLIERPLRQGRFTRLSARRQWLTYLATALVVAAMAMLPARTPAPDRELNWPAASAVPTNILAAGDSTMLRLWSQFPYDRYPATAVGGPARIGCGFMDQSYMYGSEIRDPSDCQGWEQAWREQVATRSPQVAVVGNVVWDVYDRYVDGQVKGPGTPEFDGAYIEALRRAIAAAGNDGQLPVYVLGQPCMATNVVGDVLNDPDRSAKIDGLIRAGVEASANTRYVDIRQLTCDDDGKAITSRDGRLLRDDGVHWVQPGSDEVWSLVLTQMQADGVAGTGP